ncbi:N-acetylglucosamine-1-phosphotransferase subunit gamma-like [Ostrea edulis]|uniref:N-acetylglucosamine-1-phosphotransferase subunit gamma-like n=1 Tax=Ostrea edulis TaxID=37623 RepID=UPI0024AF1EDE|nr:N-acetylglucosamine-1-phosphotransferase subunit gamma-like [Ostrea edulis]
MWPLINWFSISANMSAKTKSHRSKKHCQLQCICVACQRIFIVFLFLLFFEPIVSEMVSMKIVEEPSSYGLNNYNFASHSTEDKRLKMRIQPSNFTGPAHLKRLYGRCFTKELNEYKYEFCPFFNVTQHEQSYRWNPFSGVLGVYQEWEIENNTFTAMNMREGEKCGNIHRTVKVIFSCGDKHDIVNVTEPSTCNYHMGFTSPYVCHRDSMLVYPTLREELQEAWDQLEGELYREEITQKGYDKQLRNIFEKAGFYIPQKEKKLLAEKAVKQEEAIEKEEKGEFDTLPKCTEEYKKLKKEIEGLRSLLALKDDKDTSNVSTEMAITKQQKKKSKNSRRKENFLKALSPKSKKT